MLSFKYFRITRDDNDRIRKGEIIHAIVAADTATEALNMMSDDYPEIAHYGEWHIFQIGLQTEGKLRPGVEVISRYRGKRKVLTLYIIGHQKQTDQPLGIYLVSATCESHAWSLLTQLYPQVSFEDRDTSSIFAIGNSFNTQPSVEVYAIHKSR